MDDAVGPPLLKGHSQGVQDQLCLEIVGHRPADHSAAKRIYDDRQEEEPSPGRDIGDVGHPQTIRGIRREVSPDQTRCRRSLGPSDRRTHSLAPAHPRQACRMHQTGHALAAQ